MKDSSLQEQKQKSGQRPESKKPDVSVAHAILLILSEEGACGVRHLMRHPYARSLAAERTENSFYTALARLKNRRYILRTPQREYELTSTGEYAALKASIRKGLVDLEHKDSPPDKKEWDGRWRIVTFDVPEKQRPIRDYIRSVLKRLGCYEFQRSMWIYPFKFPPFISKLFEDHHLRSYAKIITTYDIDYDADLRKYFRLG